MITRKMIALGAAVALMISCGDDDEAGTIIPETGNLELNLTGLEDLGPGFTYEGWVIVDGTPVTTGLFTVDANGEASNTSFPVAQELLDVATKFVLSIEPVPDPDPAPSEQKLVAGDFVNGTTTVSTGVAPALGDFSAAAGTFFMRTPTDEADGVNNGNDYNGVWFGTAGMPPLANFTLPELGIGWRYEGWVISDAGPVSTGVFEAADSTTEISSPGYNSPLYPVPPVPGEDFFENAPDGVDFPMDVRGRTVVISVEPWPDNSPAPFLLKPLLGVAGQETAPINHDFNVNPASFPGGTVTIN